MTRQTTPPMSSKKRRNPRSLDFRACPRSRARLSSCFRLCEPTDGLGSCGKAAPHATLGRTQQAIARQKAGETRPGEERVCAPIETRALTPESWPDLERLFGMRGACGGCWCQYWRLPKSDRWAQIKGAVAKGRMKQLVLSGQAHGILAFAGGEPVGWCAFDRRRDFDRLDRSPSLACDDADRVWSLPCFFVRAGHRGQGVARAMLGHAIEALAGRGAEVAEGYPTIPSGGERPIPAAFAWTGTLSLFEKAGFERVDDKPKGKVRVRLGLPARVDRLRRPRRDSDRSPG